MSCGEDSAKEGSWTSSLNYPDHGLKTSCVKGGTHPDIVRAQIERKSIFAYDLTSTGAQDYQNVVEELLGNSVAMQSSGNVIPFRKKRRGIGALKEQKSERTAKAD